ncbi:MAG TPA: methyltransferase domain-containing protein, partial [Actinophytocola sp.]|uniref:methyltransferase domain-containing protein n=1 Tax=Actinophytocola sp. TaxID=1872138 RepID=UPI002DDD36D9
GGGPGERAADIGSGTGDELQALAAAVLPGGEAIGVEPNAGLRAEAARRATEAGSAATFVDGDAYALPFPDASVDVARCERVWQHLDHPERAAIEIARVLRSGGRVALIDTDWATAIIHPGDPEVLERLHRFWLSRFPNPLSGRRLTGQLTAAGLVVDDLGSQALIQDARAIDTIMTMSTDLALAEGVITEPERDNLVADLRAGASRGDFHFSVTMFGVLAHKP